MFYFKNNKDETYSVSIAYYPGYKHFLYTLALGNVKPIKLRFEGDTRARELGMTDTHDQTIDTQIQTKLGVSVVVDNLIAKYELV